jgi:hypothetical protein
MTTTTTTSAGSTPASQPALQASSVSTTVTPQKTQQATFFSSVFSPQISTYFIAGGVAGAASRTVVSPLERIKIIQSVFLLGFWLATRGLTMIRTTHLPLWQTGAARFGRRETVPGCLEQSSEDMARRRLRWIHERERNQLLANRAIQRCPVYYLRTTQEGAVGLVKIDLLGYASVNSSPSLSSSSPTTGRGH